MSLLPYPLNIVIPTNRYKKKTTYEYWVQHYYNILNMLYDNIYTYKIMNTCEYILEECDFDLFCRFCYENSSGEIVELD